MFEDFSDRFLGAYNPEEELAFDFLRLGHLRLGQKKKKKISRVSTNSIDPVFGESGIFFFFCFSHILKVTVCCLSYLTLHFWYLIVLGSGHY